MELARQLAISENGASPLPKQSRPPESKGPPTVSAGVKTTGASTHKKSASAIGSITSQRGRGAAGLSQEQFEMIMMNSEQEEGRQKAPPASNEKPKPPPTVIENDI